MLRVNFSHTIHFCRQCGTAVEQRVPDEPMVIQPLREIGKYGGTLRRGFTGPGDKYNGWRLCGTKAWRCGVVVAR